MSRMATLDCGGQALRLTPQHLFAIGFEFQRGFVWKLRLHRALFGEEGSQIVIEGCRPPSTVGRQPVANSGAAALIGGAALELGRGHASKVVRGNGGVLAGRQAQAFDTVARLELQGRAHPGHDAGVAAGFGDHAAQAPAVGRQLAQ